MNSDFGRNLPELYMHGELTEISLQILQISIKNNTDLHMKQMPRSLF